MGGRVEVAHTTVIIIDIINRIILFGDRTGLDVR